MQGRRSFVSLAGFIISIVSLLIAATVHASVEYVVRKGDTPSKIAKKFKVGAGDIVTANQIEPKNLKPGTKIVIPGGKSLSEKHKVGKTAAKKKGRDNDKVEHARRNDGQAPAEAASGNLYHTVRKGDTIASIARKYAISTSELRELNNLRSSRLKAKRKLLVKRIGPKTYVVRKDDTINKIAIKFDMEPEVLMELNEMDAPELKVGQKLYLEEKVEPESVENYNVIQAKNIEEELKKVAVSEEFTEQDSPNKVIVFAKKLIDIPYKFGGTTILGIDCSAYVKKVYGLLGVSLPRTAREQFKTGEAIDKDDLAIGDLVFFKTYASFPSHVGIYLGNNLFIHASSRGKKVTIDSLETPYYLKRFIGGKRLLTESEHEEEPNG